MAYLSIDETFGNVNVAVTQLIPKTDLNNNIENGHWSFWNITGWGF